MGLRKQLNNLKHGYKSAFSDLGTGGKELLTESKDFFSQLGYVLIMIVLLITLPLWIWFGLWYIKAKDKKDKNKILEQVPKQPQQVLRFAEQRIEQFDDPFYKHLKQMCENELNN